MPKIVDIRFIAGRRRQAIEEEKANPTLTTHDMLRKFAEHRYAAWLKTGRGTGDHGCKRDFKSWLSGVNNDHDMKKMFEAEWHQKEIWDEWKSYGETVPSKEKKEEVSLEQQILDHLNDGWVLKGEIIPTDNRWVQTLVKYESGREDDLLGLQTTESDKKDTVPALNIIE